MKPNMISVSLVLVLSHVDIARSDFAGPSIARHALSPDGKLVVRIETRKPDDKLNDSPMHQVSYYEFDTSKDSYVRRSSFQLTGYLSQMLYVSNSGDLIMISLADKHVIRLYSEEGKLTKSWGLQDFLTKEEIEACAKTGSTLQWLEEAAFYGRAFYMRGPSRLIRALSPPYTVMRGPDDKVTFEVLIDVETAKLKKYDTEER